MNTTTQPDWLADIAAATAGYCRNYKQQRDHERTAAFMGGQAQAEGEKITRRVARMLLPSIHALLRRLAPGRRVWLERHYFTVHFNHTAMTAAPHARIWLAAKCTAVEMSATLYDQAAVDHFLRRIEAAITALAAHPVE